MAVIQSYLDERKAAANSPPPLAGSAAVAATRDPDDYSNVMRIADKYGVEPSVVEDNRQDFDQLEKEREIDAEAIEQRSPKTAAWLSNPNNASVARDDTQSLEDLEAFFGLVDKPWYSVSLDDMENLGSTTLESAKQGLRAAARAAIDFDGSTAQSLMGVLAPASPLGVIKDVGDAVTGGVFTKKWDTAKVAVADQLLADIKAGEQRIEDLTPENLSVLAQGVRGGLQSVAEQVPGMLASIVTRSPVPSLAQGFAMSGARAYGSGLAEGKSPLQAAAYGYTDGLIEVATEMGPTKLMLKLFGKSDKGYARRSLEFLVSDIGGEQAATALQTINAYAHGLDEELAKAKDAGEMLRIQGERQAVTLFAAIVGSGTQATVLGGTAAAVNRLQRKTIEETSNVMQSQVEAEGISQLITLSQSSRTNERANAQFKEFLDSAAGEREVYINAEQAAILLDQGIQAPQTVIDQMADNESSGADVVVSMAEFLANREFAEAIKDFAKLSPERKTRAELNADPTSVIRQMAEQAEQQVRDAEVMEAAVADLAGQLNRTGRVNAQDSKDSMATLEAYLTRVMSEYGMTAEQAVDYVATRFMTPAELQAERAAKRDAEPAAEPERRMAQPDFEGLQITETLEVAENGETVETTVDAAQEWQRNTQRRDVLDQLAVCVRGG